MAQMVKNLPAVRMREGKFPDVIRGVLSKTGKKDRTGTGRSEGEQATVGRALGCSFLCQGRVN